MATWRDHGRHGGIMGDAGELLVVADVFVVRVYDCVDCVVAFARKNAVPIGRRTGSWGVAHF